MRLLVYRSGERNRMNERDKFLTETIGRCNHDTPHLEDVGWDKWLCSKCGKHGSVTIHPDTGDHHGYLFDTWNGFGLLWEWSQKQDWFRLFTCKQMFVENRDAPFEKVDDDGNFHKDIINPTKFADALYEFLKLTKSCAPRL